MIIVIAVILASNLLLLLLLGSIKVSDMVANKLSEKEFSTKHEIIYMVTGVNLMVISVLIVCRMLYLILG